MGRLVVLEHVLKGQNLDQHGSHLSQIEREQARPLLVNQRDQMRQRVLNYMLAAYGISTADREAIDTAHDLDEHYRSLNPALTLQPPVGASFKAALEHLMGQALAHQFPAHPDFAEPMSRRGLQDVLAVIRQACQAPDGRLEVDRHLRERVRQIAVPLNLIDMGEAHLVLREDWTRHFLRKQAETGESTFTVRRLRSWIDEPVPMGLIRDIQNLVILAFAYRNHFTFALHGGPVPGEPKLDKLDDVIELLEQRLPSEDLWQEATRRAGAILGLADPVLSHASAMAQFAEHAQQLAARFQPAIAELCQALHQALDRFDCNPSMAPRMQTAWAAQAFVSGIVSADREEGLNAMVTAHIETSEAAMGEALRQAHTLCQTLTTTQWGLFETLQRLTDEPAASDLIERVKEALTRDEHVTPLMSTLREAQNTALSLIARRVETSAAPPRPDPTQPRVVPAPAPPAASTSAPSDVSISNNGLGLDAATALFNEISQALAADGDLVVDVQWCLYHKSQEG